MFQTHDIISHFFRCNELCLVKFEDQWERAAYQKSNTFTCDMVLVDKLCFVSIPREIIRKLPSYLATDFFSSLCRIKNPSTGNQRKIQASEVLSVTVELDNNDKSFVLTNVHVANS